MKNFFALTLVLLMSCSPDKLDGDDISFNQDKFYYTETGMGYDLEITNLTDNPISVIEIRVFSPVFDYNYLIEDVINPNSVYVVGFYHTSYQGDVNYEVVYLK